MKVSVQYFASLRESSGIEEEQIETATETVSDFYLELAKKYQFSLQLTSVRFAVNGQFVPAASLLKEGDRVVFIPPVAGG